MIESKIVPAARKRRRKDETVFRLVTYPLLIIFALMCIVPFLLVIGASFDSEQSIARNGYHLIPRDPTLASYAQIFSNGSSIARAYGITTFITVVGTAASTFINMMTGYVLMRKDFKWRNGFSFYFFFFCMVLFLQVFYEFYHFRIIYNPLSIIIFTPPFLSF